MAIKHANVKAPLQKLFAVADWNANHTGTATPESHGIADNTKHSSAATSGKMLKADANGLPADATNTDTDVADAVTKRHSQNTDTALGSGCEAADHGAAATDQVVNVCYGTGNPPAANTTTEGTLYVKYTA